MDGGINMTQKKINTNISTNMNNNNQEKAECMFAWTQTQNVLALAGSLTTRHL